MNKDLSYFVILIVVIVLAVGGYFTYKHHHQPNVIEIPLPNINID